MDIFGIKKKGLEKKIKAAVSASRMKLLDKLLDKPNSTYDWRNINGDGTSEYDYDGAVHNLMRKLREFSATEVYLSDIDLHPDRMGLTKGPKISVIAYKAKSVA